MIINLKPFSVLDNIVLVNQSICFSRTLELYASSEFFIKSSITIKSAPNPVAVPVGDVAK